MEGMLYKWTNYISGWQPRWFVLDGGTLSYYDSQEDTWKGCKGSIKVCACEIKVHSTDLTRLDLTIPGEQYFYLKALNAAERQKWLVALGTAKACFTDNSTKREKELQVNTKALKSKMSELRLYCDLLLEQVGRIQGNSPDNVAGSAEEDGRAQVVSLLKSTCSTFLKTLEDCMLIASRTFSQPHFLLQTPPGSPSAATVKPQKVKPGHQSNQGLSENLKRKKSDSSRSQAGRVIPECSGDPPGAPAEGSRTHAGESLLMGVGNRDTEAAVSEPGMAQVEAQEKKDPEGSICAEKERAILYQQQNDAGPALADREKIGSAQNEKQNSLVPNENEGHNSAVPDHSE